MNENSRNKPTVDQGSQHGADSCSRAASQLPDSWLVDFYGRDFLITKDVLIPRPESEMLIDEVLTLAGKSYLPGVKASEAVLSPDNLKIADIGTGSGCLAVTLKLELPEANVTAVDVSREALSIAKANACRLQAPITFIISHLFDFVNKKSRNGSSDLASTTVKESPFNLIVANLPYVDESWDWLDREALAKEPRLALYAKDHGLVLIKELIRQAESLQIPRLILEADPCQHELIIDFATKYGYSLLETRGFCLVLTK